MESNESSHFWASLVPNDDSDVYVSIQLVNGAEIGPEKLGNEMVYEKMALFTYGSTRFPAVSTDRLWKVCFAGVTYQALLANEGFDPDWLQRGKLVLVFNERRDG